MKRILHLWFLLLSPITMILHAQAHLSGNLYINTQTGVIHAHLEIREIPKAAKDLELLLHSDLEIQKAKDKPSALLSHISHRSEMNISYYQIEEKLLKKEGKIILEYKGVLHPERLRQMQEIDSEDAKNGFHLSEWDYWYPVLYSNKSHQEIIEYSYDIDISTNPGNYLFLNGSQPKQLSIANFESDRAVPLSLYVSKRHFHDYLHSVFSRDAEVPESTYRIQKAMKYLEEQMPNRPLEGEDADLLFHPIKVKSQQQTNM